MYQFIVKVYKNGHRHEYPAIAPNWFELWDSATKRYFPCHVYVKPMK